MHLYLAVIAVRAELPIDLVMPLSLLVRLSTGIRLLIWLRYSWQSTSVS